MFVVVNNYITFLTNDNPKQTFTPTLFLSVKFDFFNRVCVVAKLTESYNEYIFY